MDTYGVKLRFEEKSVDDEARVTRWINPVAPGLKEDKEKPAIHAQDFRGITRQKLTDIPIDKLAIRYGGHVRARHTISPVHAAYSTTRHYFIF